MKASKFTDAQKAFIKQAEDGTSVSEVCRKADLLGDVLQLEEEGRGAFAIRDEAAQGTRAEKRATEEDRRGHFS